MESQRDALSRSTLPLPAQRLGIPEGAPAETVKRAFKAAARLLHPDKCKLPGAEAAFKRIHEAYDVLISTASTSAIATAAPASSTSAAESPRASVPADTHLPAANTAASGLFRSKGGAKKSCMVKVAPAPKPPQFAATDLYDDSDEDSFEDIDGVTIGAAHVDDRDNADGDPSDNETSDEEEEDDTAAGGLSFAGDDASAPPAKRPRQAKKKAATARKQPSKPRRRPQRDSGDEDDDLYAHRRHRARNSDWRESLSSAQPIDGSSRRQSRRLAGRARVDYRAVEGSDSDGKDGLQRGRAHGHAGSRCGDDDSWVPPLWFEYQTDSDDSEGEARRKKQLKERVRAAKRAEAAAKNDATSTVASVVAQPDIGAPNMPNSASNVAGSAAPATADDDAVVEDDEEDLLALIGD